MDKSEKYGSFIFGFLIIIVFFLFFARENSEGLISSEILFVLVYLGAMNKLEKKKK